MRLANLDNQRGNLELLEQRTVCFQKVICLLVAYFRVLVAQNSKC